MFKFILKIRARGPRGTFTFTCILYVLLMELSTRQKQARVEGERCAMCRWICMIYDILVEYDNL